MSRWTNGYVFGLLSFAVLFGTRGAMAQNLQYQSKVFLEVGQSALIHAARGECGQQAPDWGKVAPLLPKSSTGKFSDGGLSTRKSQQCDGITPARVIRFTATTLGSEQIELEGDTIYVEVRGVGVAMPSGGTIPYQSKVLLEVGQSTIIDGARGDCGQQAPDWEKVSPLLPTLSTGKFSDAGSGVRNSQRCGGSTPARAIRFTATAPGTEQIELFGDPIRIEVR